MYCCSPHYYFSVRMIIIRQLFLKEIEPKNPFTAVVGPVVPIRLFTNKFVYSFAPTTIGRELRTWPVVQYKPGKWYNTTIRTDNSYTSLFSLTTNPPIPTWCEALAGSMQGPSGIQYVSITYPRSAWWYWKPSWNQRDYLRYSQNSIFLVNIQD